VWLEGLGKLKKSNDIIWIQSPSLIEMVDARDSLLLLLLLLLVVVVVVVVVVVIVVVMVRDGKSIFFLRRTDHYLNTNFVYVKSIKYIYRCLCHSMFEIFEI
jgi:hypothetical protein